MDFDEKYRISYYEINAYILFIDSLLTLAVQCYKLILQEDVCHSIESSVAWWPERTGNQL